MAESLGRLFPSLSALVVMDADSCTLVAPSGSRTTVRGPLCADIERSLDAGAVTPALRAVLPAHAALGELATWLETASVPLTREHAVRLDGFDTLFVELLGRCNERCVHCYADSAPTVDDALDRETAFAVIDEAAQLGFRRIQFTGGDPLLCEFLPDAVAHAARRAIPSIEIFTNGLALTDELLQRLAPHGPGFAFSVYSIDADVHDRTTRTPGSHRRTLAAIDRVVARGLSCRAAAVVLEEGGDVDALVAMLRARGVGFVSWSRAFAVGRGTDVAETSRTVAAGTRARTQIDEGGGHRAPASEPEHHIPGGKRLGGGKLCVTYRGDVVPCIFQRHSILGNVRGGASLAAILTAPVTAAPRRGLPTVDDAGQRLQCTTCRLTDRALGWLAGRGRDARP